MAISDVETVLESLRSQLRDAQVHLSTASRLREKVVEEETGASDLRRFDPFFPLTYKAHMDAALMSVFRVADKRSDAVSIRHFFGVVRKNAGAFKHATAQDIRKSVDADEEKFEEVEDLVYNLREHRRKIHAHLSQEYIDDPESFHQENPLSLDEIQKAIDQLDAILRPYTKYIGGEVLTAASQYEFLFTQRVDELAQELQKKRWA